MYKIITNVCNVLLFTVTIMFFSVLVVVLLVVLLIGPQGDNSKENMLLTSNFVLALVSAVAVNNIVTRDLNQ